MNKYLRKTGQRLSMQFAVIILALLWTLGICFFAVRAFTFHHLSEQNIKQHRVNIQRVFDGKAVRNLPREFMLVDKQTLEVVKNNQRAFEPEEILEKFDPAHMPQKPLYFEREKETFKVFATIIIDKKSEKQYYAFVIQRFPFNPKFFLYEGLYFVLFTLIVSFVIYLIGRCLAMRNLKPVESMIHKLEQFTHDASHELKTPISVIYSDLQLAKKTGNHEQAIDSAMEEIQSLNGLVDKLLTLAQPDKEHIIAPHNMGKLIKNSLKKLSKKAKEKSITLDYSQIEENTTLHCSKEQFQIVVKNLVENAIKYSPENSTVNIIANSKKLSIVDSGIGIPKKDLERIFDRFFQEDHSRNAEGFGIGLSLVKKIAEEHNWQLNVQSKKGKGSTFTIYF